MFDFDVFNIADFPNFEETAEQVPTSSTRERFDLATATHRLSGTRIIPEGGESIRMLSPAGGWSSCALVCAMARKVNIHSIFISTLRVGKKELDALAALKIPRVTFALSDMQRQNQNRYDYASYFENICRENGYSWRYVKNHSKIILLDTDAGKIVVETSSNFNENPKIEQFCIVNSEEVYDFYTAELKKCGVMA